MEFGEIVFCLGVTICNHCYRRDTITGLAEPVGGNSFGESERTLPKRLEQAP
jgi:hypothetical protein